MPIGVLKGSDSEKYWEMAKKSAKEQYPGLESKDRDRFYAIVMSIYKKMCKGKDCSPKEESMTISGNSLVESVRDIVESVITEAADSRNGDLASKAKRFFIKGVLPDGSKWGGSTALKFASVNDVRINKASTKEKDGTVNYTASVIFTPGKGGGGGITMDAAASNHLFNMVGTEQKKLDGVASAFSSVSKGRSRGLNESVRRWFVKPENFVHNIVGWKNRKDYVIDDVSFSSITYGTPMVDPTRRKWPAGRTEIWQPVVANVNMKLRRK